MTSRSSRCVGTDVHVANLEATDGTPVLDIKPGQRRRAALTRRHPGAGGNGRPRGTCWRRRLRPRVHGVGGAACRGTATTRSDAPAPCRTVSWSGSAWFGCSRPRSSGIAGRPPPRAGNSWPGRCGRRGEPSRSRSDAWARTSGGRSEVQRRARCGRHRCGCRSAGLGRRCGAHRPKWPPGGRCVGLQRARGAERLPSSARRSGIAGPGGSRAPVRRPPSWPSARSSRRDRSST